MLDQQIVGATSLNAFKHGLDKQDAEQLTLASELTASRPTVPSTAVHRRP